MMMKQKNMEQPINSQPSIFYIIGNGDCQGDYSYFNCTQFPSILFNQVQHIQMGSVSRSLRRYYSSKCLTEANMLCVIVYFLALAVPFYLSFSTQNFWLKPVTEPLTITHSFSGNYIATINYAESTSETLSNIAELKLTTPTPTKYITGISKGNAHSFNINIPAAIHNIELILFFNTKISQLNRQDYTAAVVNLGGLSQSSIYSALGSLSFSAQSPISYISSSNIKQNLPPYFFDFTYIADVQAIKRNIFKGDYILNSQIISSSGNYNSAPGALNINLQFMSSVLTDVTYYPSFLRTLKIAFSQYVSLFIIAFVLATGFLRLLAKSDVFPLQESSDHREVLWSVKNRY